MKEPSLRNLAIDEKGTRHVRRKMARTGKIKITINLDRDSLKVLRSKSDQTGIPYQRLLNQVLRRALSSEDQTESRLERLEKEVAKLKRKSVA